MSPVQRSRDRDAVWRSSWGSDGIDARFGIMFAAGRDATESFAVSRGLTLGLPHSDRGITWERTRRGPGI